MTLTRAIFPLVTLALCLPVSTAQAQRAARTPAAPRTQPAAASQSQPALTPDQWMARAEEASTAGDYATAIQGYSNVLAAEPTNQDAAIGLADCLMKVRNHLKAKEIYDVCLKRSPDDWRANFGLGNIYLQREYYKLARPLLERAAALAPEKSRAQVRVNLAVAFRGLHQMPEAIEQARLAIAHDPSSLEARRMLISLYLEDKRLEDAVAENVGALGYIRKNLTAQPDDRQMLAQMIQVLGQMIDLLQRKLAAQPDDATVRLQLIDNMEQQGLIGQQLTYYQELDLLQPALDKTPDNPDLLLARARLLHLVGRPAQAVADLRKILAASPNNTKAKLLLERVEPSPTATQPAP